MPISYQSKYYYCSGNTKQELKGKALNDFLLKKAGLPEPLIENVFGGIQVTLFKTQFDKSKLIELGLNNRQIKAIAYLKEKPENYK